VFGEYIWLAGRVRGLSAEAEELLAELGWHPRFGARPLTRVVEEKVLTPIAVELSRRPSQSRMRVRVERSGQALSVSFQHDA